MTEENKISLIIDNDVLDMYSEHYFSMHPRAHKKPIPFPYHESINKWMIMKRPMMNALKGKWKEFIIWYINEQGYANLRIDKCEIAQIVYYPNTRRHDTDNSVPKFILDGLVDGGMIVDDDMLHLTKLTLQCGIDREHPRTELHITVLNEDDKSSGVKGGITNGKNK